MAVKSNTRNGKITALAVGLAALALPAAASAQDHHGDWHGQGQGQGNGGSAPSPSASPTHAQNGGAPHGSWRPQSGGQTSMQAPATVSTQQANRWQGNGGQGNWQHNNGAPYANRYQQATPPAQVQTQSVPQRQWQGNPNWQQNRAEPQREWRGNGGDRGRDWNRNAGNNAQPNRTWQGNAQANRGNWNHDWRADNRYDWRGWRNDHHDLYRAGRYRAPYSDFRYSRLRTGFFLEPLFFGSDYWINDPWDYRLPPAYGPYHWVRYYDDVLLVDTYTGEVVDVIYDFFE